MNGVLPQTVYVRESAIVGNPKATPPVQGILPIGHTTLWRWVKQSKFPKPVKLGANVTAWRCQDVRDWMAQRDAASARVVH
jgi:prophage regulatory protein